MKRGNTKGTAAIGTLAGFASGITMHGCGKVACGGGETPITEGRIPDHHGWKQYSISTLGEPNDLVKTASSQLMIPEIFALYQNYPNPFNSETTISFDLLQTATISLYVNDAAGRIIHLFFEENKMNKGLYSYTWNGENFSSGLYFMTIQAQIDDYLPIIFSRKMIYLK